MFFVLFSVLHIFSSHSRHSGYSTIRCSIGQNLDIYYCLTKKSSGIGMLPFAYCFKGACPLSLCAHATQILRKGDECLTVQNAVSFLCAALSTQPFFTQLRLGPCGKDAVVTGITPCTLRRLGLYSWRESNPHGCSPADFESAVYTNSTTGAKRRGWDSNPCAQKDKRFSRPPRYDRFDTSP